MKQGRWASLIHFLTGSGIKDLFKKEMMFAVLFNYDMLQVFGMRLLFCS